MRFQTTPTLLVAIASLLACNGQISSTDRSAPGAAPPEVAGPPPPSAPSAPKADAPAFVDLGYPPDALTNDAQYLYWSELNTVYRASKIAPVRERLFGDGTSPASALAVDDTYVYASDHYRGNVRAWRKADGVVEDWLPEGAGARALAQDGENLYVGTIEAGARTGVVVIAKASHEETSVLRAGSSVFAVALTGTTLFTLESDAVGFRVVRSSLHGDESVVVGKADYIPHQFVADGGEAYWVDVNRGLQSSRSGSPLYAPRPNTSILGGLAIVDGFAHVVESGPEVLGIHVRVPVAGGEPEIIGAFAWSAATGGAHPRSGLFLTGDDSLYTSAYWSNESGARGDAILRSPLVPPR